VTRLLFAIACAVVLCADVVIAAEPAGLSAEATYSVNGVSSVRLSPQGSWVSAEARSGARRGLLAQNVAIGSKAVPLIATEEPLDFHRWVDDDTLIARFTTRGVHTHVLIDLDLVGGEVRVERNVVNANGYLVSADPGREDSLLWETIGPDFTYVNRLTTEELMRQGVRKNNRGRSLRLGDHVLQVPGVIDRWLTDSEGEPQVAIRTRGEEGGTAVLRRGKRSRVFDEVYWYDENEDSIQPVGLVPDSRSMWVLAYAGHDTRGVHVFDPDLREIVGEVFRREDVDVTGALIDRSTGKMFGVESFVDGERRVHYLGDVEDRISAHREGIEKRYAVESIEIYDVSPDGQILLFYRSDATDPGHYGVHDLRSGALMTVGLRRSDVDRGRLSKVDVFRVESQDGLEVEAYLTIPKVGDAPYPLVVMPHGGPHGVRDDRLYDPFAQYLASWGFAVLQPNYRGSAGYGRAYYESIKKQWAKAIEDDIDAAVEHAIAMPEIDGNRIAIVGGSYGGFSALASVVRHRDRYRCAVSMNGVSDIPLLYDSSDMADSKRVMDFYQEFVGDLETERDVLEDASPTYHVDAIETPVLFIYGDRDRRVDPDHSLRMMLTMDLLGKPYERLEVEGMRHSPTPLQWVIVSRATRRMLTKHLMPGAELVPDPDIGASGTGRLKHRFDVDF